MAKRKLNTDIRTYEFENKNLEEAVGKLREGDRRIIILTLMGFTHWEIAKMYNRSRSWCTKEVTAIIERLREIMTGEDG